MKRFLLFFFTVTIFILDPLFSQELIKNGGFEEYILPPDSLAQWQRCVGWRELLVDSALPLVKGVSTPDFYHMDGILKDKDGSKPYTGKGYMGLITLSSYYYNNPNSTTAREYISTRLNESLQIGKEYKLVFYILQYYPRLSNTNPDSSKLISHNGIGFNFSTRPVYLENRKVHVINSSSQCLITKPEFYYEWTRFEFEFIADSAFNYMTFGTLYPDSIIEYTKKPLNPSHPYPGSYMFIDNVSLVPAWLYITGINSICKGESTQLRATNHNGTSKWALLDKPKDIFSEDTIVTVSPQKTTTYLVYNAEDTATFTVYVKDYSVELGNDTTICLGEQFMLKPMLPGASFTWDNGAEGDSLMASKNKVYTVAAIIDGCIVYDSLEVFTEFCSCEVSIPNAFTPNGDEMNEGFGARFGCNIKLYNLSIFNRWGDKVFETQDRNLDWDGKFSGRDVPEGLYVYRLTYTLGNGTKEDKNGKVLVMR